MERIDNIFPMPLLYRNYLSLNDGQFHLATVIEHERTHDELYRIIVDISGEIIEVVNKGFSSEQQAAIAEHFTPQHVVNECKDDIYQALTSSHHRSRDVSEHPDYGVEVYYADIIEIETSAGYMSLEPFAE